MAWYHISPKRLPIGFEISPGTWGRKILARKDSGIYERELALEAYRRKHFPTTKPSRLESSFALPNSQSCLKYYISPNEKSGHIYKVAPKYRLFLHHVGPIMIESAMDIFGASNSREEFYWTFAIPKEDVIGTREIILEDIEIVVSCPLYLVQEVSYSELEEQSILEEERHDHYIDIY